jgi:lipoyl(octanoyl) transferase
MAAVLRIILDSPRAASLNMAADLLLLERAADAERATLRFYTWEPPAVSLGWNERAESALNLPLLEADGIDWVRRPTGGRAVLHHTDLTYSIVFPRGMKLLGGSIQQSYHVICACLMRGLRLAGIACDAHDSVLDTRLVRGQTKLPCFLAPNRDEIMCQGRKLLGSAQKRTSSSVLQHGSIPMTGAFRALPRYLRIDNARREAYERLLSEKCACVEQLAPGLSRERLTEYLVKGFVEQLGFESVREPWCGDEIERIRVMECDPEFRATYLAK